MSLIERLKQMVGAPPEAAVPDRTASVPAPESGGSNPWLALQKCLTSVRSAMGEYGALAPTQEEGEQQVRYWTERLKQAERMVEREPVGSEGAIKASESAGNASHRLSQLNDWVQGTRAAIEAARPSYELAGELLTEVRIHEDRARSLTPGLAVEEAAAEAALHYMDRPDETGRTPHERLREAEAVLRAEVRRAQSLRPPSPG